MKVALVAVGVAFAVLLISCGGRGAIKTAPAGSGQDYLAGVQQSLTLFQRAQADAGCSGADTLKTKKCDLDKLSDAVNDFEDDWRALHPPDEIAPQHDALGESTLALIDLAGIVGLPTADVAKTVEKDPSLVQDALRYRRTFQEWRDAVQTRYQVVYVFNEGASMEPTLSDNDVSFFAEPDGTIDRGQIIVFKFPLDRERHFVKRVVGLPGETVEIKDGAVFVDGRALDEKRYTLATPNYTYGPRVVPPNSYFVLGDNRRNSYDSHAWGASCGTREECEFVPESDILGELPADYKRDDPTDTTTDTT